MKITTLLSIISLVLIFSCENVKNIDQKLISEGVSRELADLRKENFTDLTYNLHFNIPQSNDEDVTGDVKIGFKTQKSIPIIIDFFAPSENVKEVVVNSKKVDVDVKNQHIIIDAEYCNVGDNVVEVNFVSTNRSLNRREDFIYTLLVPDRARALFPLFEQPNMKAQYELTLSVADSWTSISNSGVVEQKEEGEGRKTVKFQQTEAISSYLFAFATGKFEQVSKMHNGRVHKIYHRETDARKLAQFNDIFDLLFHSLDWLEEYTNIDYPFAKYDMVLIPGFQYGGMEHIGATFYNASTMFLSPTPTMSERVRRATLVAHETAHMWFGDLVTMKWFDDVWTKEVFANYFASKIAAPLFPEIDNRQTMLSYFASAFSEDRTVGGTSIKQNLANLKYAGLVYNSIIYNKSPLVLNMIAEMLGEEPFREAVGQTLKKFSYDNASWDDWVAIFDAHSDKNITKWAHNWMYKSGMPKIEIKPNGKVVEICQKDPKNRGLLWEQAISFMIVGENGQKRSYRVNLNGEKVIVDVDFTPKYIVPNNDGMGYGYFVIGRESLEYILNNFSSLKSSVERRTALINIYENVLNNFDQLSEQYILSMLKLLPTESDPMIYSTIISNVSSVYNTYFKNHAPKELVERVAKIYDASLWNEYQTNSSASNRVVAFKSLSSNLLTPTTIEKVYDMWEKGEIEGIVLGEDSYMSISYKLAIKMKDKSGEIVDKQLCRIKNPDLKEQYLFISQAVLADKDKRDQFFNSLLDENNRTVESWTQSALSLLMAYREGDNSRDKYIPLALAELEEIQKTGDIFFPQGWCRSLLGGCTQKEAFEAVNAYLSENKDIEPMLKSKLLIAADHLYRIYDH